MINDYLTSNPKLIEQIRGLQIACVGAKKKFKDKSICEIKRKYVAKRGYLIRLSCKEKEKNTITVRVPNLAAGLYLKIMIINKCAK